MCLRLASSLQSSSCSLPVVCGTTAVQKPFYVFTRNQVIPSNQFSPAFHVYCLRIGWQTVEEENRMVQMSQFSPKRNNHRRINMRVTSFSTSGNDLLHKAAHLNRHIDTITMRSKLYQGELIIKNYKTGSQTHNLSFCLVFSYD